MIRNDAHVSLRQIRLAAALYQRAQRPSPPLPTQWPEGRPPKPAFPSDAPEESGGVDGGEGALRCEGFAALTRQAALIRARR